MGVPPNKTGRPGGALDAAKWHATNPGWLGRQPGRFRAENVTVSDGKLHITVKNESLPDAPKLVQSCLRAI